MSRKEASQCGNSDWTLPGSRHWQIAWRIILPCLSSSALRWHTTSSHYVPAKSLWNPDQLCRKMEWGGRDWLPFLFCKLVLIHITNGTWFNAWCMWAAAVKGNKCGNKKLNVRVDKNSFSHLNVRFTYDFQISRQRISWVYEFYFSAVVMFLM